jgi:endogenous inhibitor of DNA gyrase (YacG/DUF329 family)
MAEIERIAAICPDCGKPVRTGFKADFQALLANLDDENKPCNYKAKCPGCGAWIFWSKSTLKPERLLNDPPT